MINGILQRERDSSEGSESLYTYFLNNYRGSLGNMPISGNGRFEPKEGDPLEAEAGSHVIWLTPSCWRNNQSYREVLALPSGTLEQQLEKQQIILAWLDYYLSCRASEWRELASADPEAAHKINFYNEVFANPNSVINSAIGDFFNECAAYDANDSMALTECDPTEGGFGRIFANRGESRQIFIVIPECEGVDPMIALAATDAFTPFRDFMRELGSPQYGGDGTGYSPDNSAIAQPVVRFLREIREEDNGLVYAIKECRWYSNVYVRAQTPFHYPR